MRRRGATLLRRGYASFTGPRRKFTGNSKFVLGYGFLAPNDEIRRTNLRNNLKKFNPELVGTDYLHLENSRDDGYEFDIVFSKCAATGSSLYEMGTHVFGPFEDHHIKQIWEEEGCDIYLIEDEEKDEFKDFLLRSGVAESKDDFFRLNYFKKGLNY